MKYWLILLAVLILLSSCAKTSSPQDQNQAEIIEILEDIQSRFNLMDAQQIMEHYHPDFLHRGNHYLQEESIWLDRQSQFSDLTIKDINIRISGNQAIVSFVMTFKNGTQQQIFYEPGDQGDLSYFIFENGEWKIYGNQSGD